MGFFLQYFWNQSRGSLSPRAHPLDPPMSSYDVKTVSFYVMCSIHIIACHHFIIPFYCENKIHANVFCTNFIISKCVEIDNFKTARKNSTKLHTTCFQHVFNHYANFQSKWTTNVEMTVALKLGVEKSNIVDTSNIGCVWHALCTVFC